MGGLPTLHCVSSPPCPERVHELPSQDPATEAGSKRGGWAQPPGTSKPSPPRHTPRHVRIHLISAGDRLPIICVDLPLISVPPLPSIPTALPHFLK